jgi:hypothetical protein
MTSTTSNYAAGTRACGHAFAQGTHPGAGGGSA